MHVYISSLLLIRQQTCPRKMKTRCIWYDLNITLCVGRECDLISRDLAITELMRCESVPSTWPETWLSRVRLALHHSRIVDRRVEASRGYWQIYSGRQLCARVREQAAELPYGANGDALPMYKPLFANVRPVPATCPAPPPGLDLNERNFSLCCAVFLH